jgi:hypothetical protein
MPKTTDMVPISQYLAFGDEPQKVADIVRANLEGATISPFDLDRAKVPTGGATNWEVPSLDDDAAAQKQLTGIIVHFATNRAYWSQPLEASGMSSPPDCFSPDGKMGIGDPGGACATCHMNQWGTDDKGVGKACKEKRMVYLLQPDSYLPLVVQMPTMSIKAANQYFMRLAAKAIPYYGVITALGLERTQQRSGGLSYSRITLKMVSPLSGPDLELVTRYVEVLKPLMRRADIPVLQDA